MWIVRYSPTRDVDTLAQIRLSFKVPLIALERLESPDEQAKLKFFSIEPALPGRFRFLTPRLVGFQADAALPVATRVRVTVRSGLTDLKGNRLSGDFAWTFNTTPLRLTNLPSGDDPIVLTPSLTFTSNAELDPTTLARNVSLTPQHGAGAVPIKISLEKSEVPQSDSAQQKFDPSLRDWTYSIVPEQPLAKATDYALLFAAGIKPAHGNMPTDSVDEAFVHTFSPLGFVALNYVGEGPRFLKGDPELDFNNPVTQDTARANITIRPSPKPWAILVHMYDDSKSVDLDPAAFDPAKDYSITIGPGLTDTFGQTLGKEVVVRYNTGDTAPNFWVPAGLNIFASGTDLQLRLSAVNLPRAAYQAAFRVVHPADLVYADPTELEMLGGGLLPDQVDWPYYPTHEPRNHPSDIAVDLPKAIGGATGMLAYGTTAITGNRYSEPIYFGAVQLTNLGVFAQWFPSSGLVRVHHLSDGSTVPGARVDIYRSAPAKKAGAQATPCATAQTDAGGSAFLNASTLAGCMDGKPFFNAPPQLLAVARERTDWAFARTYEWSGAYDYGIYAGWDGGTPQSRGTIYSDRNLYQPGEDAWFAGAAYYLQNGVLHRDADVRYRLTLEDPNGNKTDLGALTTDEFGSFSRKVTFAKNQALGYYVIRARSGAGVQIEGQFRVAQFRPPNFKVTLSLDKEFAVAGSTVHASSQSNYLFGAPVEGGKATYYVTRRQAAFTPKGLEDYSFGRQWQWPEQPPTVDTDVLQTTATLSADGISTQDIAVAPSLPYAMTYQTDIETTDVSNLSVADSKTFTALPSSELIGVQNDWVATAGKALPVKVVVVDPSGTPLAGRRIHVELQEITYSNVTQVVEGGESALNQVEYKKVDESDVSSGKDAVTVSLTPPVAGSYRIRANFSGAPGDATATDAFVWATGDDPVFWSGQNPDQLQIKLDKPSYRPGDVATALIQSPYPNAELYFAVIRRDTMYRVVRTVRGGAPEIHFRVTADMLPNAAVEALLVRKGVALSKAEPGSVESLSHIGFAGFEVKLDANYLKVSVVPGAASVQPGGRQTVHLTLRDSRGHPARGEIVVAVANEAVLQLSGYRPPDLVSIAYADQDVSTRFADNRPNVVLAQPPSPIEKGWGFGGGFSSAAAATRIRTNFRPLAYFNGAVRTDGGGRADISFSVPDDLTTWRVMAVATGSGAQRTGDFRFGNGDATFISSKPLVSNPLLPQFARPGDTFEAGVSVTNASGLTGALQVNGTLGGALRFNEKNGPSAGDSVRSDLQKATQGYRFPVIAGAPGDAKVRFVSTTPNASDAFAVSIPIVPLTYFEQVVESGVTADRAAIPIAVDANVERDAGGLNVSLSSTLLPEIVEPARNVLDEDCLPFLEPAATQLAIAADVMILNRKYGHVSVAFSPSRVAAQDLDYLTKLQMPGGGFTNWPLDKTTDPVASAYAAQSLAAARGANMPVDYGMISALESYLKGVLANPGQYWWCDRASCWNELRFDALEALSALGDTRSDFLSDIYAGRDDLNYTRRIGLARYLLRFPEWKARGHEMQLALTQNVYETGRTATVNIQRQWWLWNDTLTAQQSQMIRLLIADGASPEFIDRMVQGLLALRRQGTWRYPYEDAQALGALIDYGAMQPLPPNFTAQALLNGRAIGSVQFEGYANPMRSFDVPMATMPSGKSDLELSKSGRGMLHYFASFDYALHGLQPGSIAGLRVLRYVRRTNDTVVLWQSGLATPSQPLTLGVGQVFDIELEVIVDHPVDRVVITDPLPAGFEAVDAAFRTSTQYFQAQTDSWQLDYQSIYRDRVVAYGDHLDAGDYSFHYLVRSVTPGTFSWPGAEAHLQYSPEIFGRSAAGVLQLTQ